MPSKRDIYMKVDPITNQIVVSGNTYDVQMRLKSVGAKWMFSEKEWQIPFISEEQFREIYKMLKEDLRQRTKANPLYKTEVIKL